MKFNHFYKGTFYTCFASVFWGLPQPLIFNAISYVPAIEVTMHRGIWSFIFLFLILVLFSKYSNLISVFSRKNIFILSITASLITINWTGFIYAVGINRVQDVSMGYYLTPMIHILLGYIFLKEKLTKFSLISLMLMLLAIIYLIYSLKTFPYIAILIGTSWGVYGLLRKQINVSPSLGLLYESFFISIFALPYLLYLSNQGSGYFLNYNTFTSFLLILSGVVTIIPLFFFNLGVKFIPLGYAGVLFYLAPTFHFITSVFILGEIIIFAKFISFIIIWIAILIFILDVLRKEKKLSRIKLNN